MLTELYTGIVMQIHVQDDEASMAHRAADCAAQAIRNAVDNRGEARVVFATGASQFAFLECLVGLKLPWDRLEAFHLDAYVGLSEDHRGSFRRFMREHFVDLVPDLSTLHYVRGDADDLGAECERLGALIGRAPVDLSCVGIGRNGRLAFNDPPADFDTEDPYLVTDLEENWCELQVEEGWFDSQAEMPRQAITMSIPQILASRRIVCTVPGRERAEAVREAVDGPVSPECPASALRKHGDCHVFLDSGSSSLLPAGARG